MTIHICYDFFILTLFYSSIFHFYNNLSTIDRQTHVNDDTTDILCYKINYIFHIYNDLKAECF